MILISGICISFFLAFLLLSKKGKTVADSVLMAWLIVCGAHLGLYYIYTSPLKEDYNFLIGLSAPFPLLHGPFLFLYTLALTNPPYFRTYRWLLHFALPIGTFLYLIPFFDLPSHERLAFLQNPSPQLLIFNAVMGVLLIVSGFGYVLWASILLRQHRRKIIQEFSYTERINLDWLQYLIYGLCFLWFFVAFSTDEWIFTIASFFIFFIGYFGIKQVGIFTYTDKFIPPQYPTIFEAKNTFSHEDEKGETVDNEEVIKKKYQKSGLTVEQAEQIQTGLTRLMTSEKLYKNSELTLSDLAEKLNIHPNYLSQVLNEKEGVSFYDYINTLRIEEFKKVAALPESKQFTLLSLAYDCGFNSKSSFNRYFKKVNELSPSEYMKNVS